MRNERLFRDRSEPLGARDGPAELIHQHGTPVEKPPTLTAYLIFYNGRRVFPG